jgi:hypothetical protein
MGKPGAVLAGDSDPAGYYGLGCVLARMACVRAGASLEARRERRAMGAPPTVIRSGDAGLTASRFHFLRHLVEMTIPMMVGMIAGAAIFTTAAGVTVDEALRRHAVPFTLVMAFSMTVPMVAWMRYRGHVWRACTEMGAAMVVPAIPLIWLRLAHVVSGPICGLYCAASFLAMVLVMLYRRSDGRGTSAVASPR